MQTEIRRMYAFDTPGKNNPGGRNQSTNMSADENDVDDDVDIEEYEGEEVDVDEGEDLDENNEIINGSDIEPSQEEIYDDDEDDEDDDEDISNGNDNTIKDQLVF